MALATMKMRVKKHYKPLASDVTMDKMDTKTLPRSVKCFIWLLGAVGFILTVTFIVNKYLKYEIFSNSDFKKNDITRPPAMSICLQDLESRGNGSYSMAEFMNGSEDFFGHRFKAITVDTEEEKYCKWYKRSPIKTNRSFFWAKNRKCMKLVTEKEMIRITELSSLDLAVFKVQANSSMLSQRIDIYLHDRDSYPYDDDAIPISTYVDSNLTATLRVTYQNVRIDYLGAPYDSPCTNYHKVGIQSQGHCIEQCMNQKYQGHCLYTVHKNDSYCSSKVTRPFKVNVSDLENCRDICFVDCKTSYFTIVHYAQDNSDDDNDIFKVKVSNGKRPQIRIDYQIKMPFERLYTYLLWSIVIWFGFSFVGTSFKVKKLLSKLQK